MLVVGPGVACIISLRPTLPHENKTCLYKIKKKLYEKYKYTNINTKNKHFARDASRA